MDQPISETELVSYSESSHIHNLTPSDDYLLNIQNSNDGSSELARYALTQVVREVIDIF